MAPELPVPNTSEQLRAVQLRNEIYKYAAGIEYFDRLTSDLKDIAIKVAIKTIMLPDSKLRLKAREVDALAYKNNFARADLEANGSLLDQDRRLRIKLTFLDDRSLDDVKRDANAQLREDLASRQLRILLAAELGYQPGKWKEIVANEDFTAANMLARLATRDFS
jgi:hypothetical protein